MWLDNLHFDFFDNENPNYILEDIHAMTGKDSMFYDDARRHMSKRMRHNIDSFENNLMNCNDYIHSSNLTIDNRIKEIIARPVSHRLTNEQISSIYRIVKIGFSQAIKGQEDVPTTIKNWDLSTKVRAHGFTIQTDTDNAKNILAAIQQDQAIIDKVTELKSMITDLETQQDVIKNQSREISSRITSHHYRGRHRCCPSLIKELWYTLF